MPQIKVPREFICSITQRLIKKPVKTCDKQTYSKHEIDKLIAEAIKAENKKVISPNTGLPLQNTDYVSNQELEAQIAQYIKEHHICSFDEFMAAVKNGDLERLKSMNYWDEYLTETDAEGYTPIHQAALCGHQNVADFLFAEGAMDSPSEKLGHSLVHCGVLGNHQKMVSYLVKEKKCDPLALNAEGLHACHLATKRGQITLVKALLDSANPDQRKTLVHGKSKNAKNNVLAIAVKISHLELTRLFLLAEGVNPLEINNSKQSAYSTAKEKNAKNPTANSIENQIFQLIHNNLLLFAAVKLDSNLASLLFAQGHSVEDCDRSSPLISRQNKQGRTALHEAVNQDNLLLVELLLQLGAHPHLLDENGVTPFQLCKSEEVRKLLQQYGLPKIITVPDRFLCASRRLPMEVPVKAADGNIYEKSVLDIFHQYHPPRSPKTELPLTDRRQELQVDLQKEIQQFRKENNLATAGKFIQTALEQPIHEFTTLVIMDSYLGLSYNQELIFILAIKKRRADVVSVFLELGFSPNIQLNDGITPLHLTTSEEFVEIVKLLMNKGARPQMMNGGFLPFHIAAMNGNTQLLALFLKSAPDVIDIPIAGSGKTALMLASENNHTSAIEFLVDNHANPLIADNRGNLPLYRNNVIIHYFMDPEPRDFLIQLLRKNPQLFDSIQISFWFTPIPELAFASPLLALAQEPKNHDTLTSLIANSSVKNGITIPSLCDRIKEGKFKNRSLMVQFTRSNEGCAFLIASLRKNSLSRDDLVQLHEALTTEIESYDSETGLLYIFNFYQGRLLFSELIKYPLFLKLLSGENLFKVVQNTPNKGISPFVAALLANDIPFLEKLFLKAPQLLQSVTAKILCTYITHTQETPLHRMISYGPALLDSIINQNETILAEFSTYHLQHKISFGPYAGMTVWDALAKTAEGRRIMRTIVEKNSACKQLPLPPAESAPAAAASSSASIHPAGLQLLRDNISRLSSSNIGIDKLDIEQFCQLSHHQVQLLANHLLENNDTYKATFEKLAESLYTTLKDKILCDTRITGGALLYARLTLSIKDTKNILVIFKFIKDNIFTINTSPNIDLINQLISNYCKVDLQTFKNNINLFLEQVESNSIPQLDEFRF